VARLESLKEVNVEVMATEARSFSTGNPLALQALFGENAHTSQQCAPLSPFSNGCVRRLPTGLSPHLVQWLAAH